MPLGMRRLTSPQNKTQIPILADAARRHQYNLGAQDGTDVRDETNILNRSALTLRQSGVLVTNKIPSMRFENGLANRCSDLGLQRVVFQRRLSCSTNAENHLGVNFKLLSIDISSCFIQFDQLFCIRQMSLAQHSF
eukprot:5989430-Amphidinium_carterae.1